MIVRLAPLSYLRLRLLEASHRLFSPIWRPGFTTVFVGYCKRDIFYSYKLLKRNSRGPKTSGGYPLRLLSDGMSHLPAHDSCLRESDRILYWRILDIQTCHYLCAFAVQFVDELGLGIGLSGQRRADVEPCL